MVLIVIVLVLATTLSKIQNTKKEGWIDCYCYCGLVRIASLVILMFGWTRLSYDEYE